MFTVHAFSSCTGVRNSTVPEVGSLLYASFSQCANAYLKAPESKAARYTRNLSLLVCTVDTTGNKSLLTTYVHIAALLHSQLFKQINLNIVCRGSM